jgi:hypothetical protein
LFRYVMMWFFSAVESESLEVIDWVYDV